MKAIVASCFGCIAITPGVLMAQEDWSEYFACADAHVEGVSQTEPSTVEGAKLIADVFCVEEAAELASSLIKARPEVLAQSQGDFAAAFESFRHVIQRETAQRVYAARLRYVAGGEQ